MSALRKANKMKIKVTDEFILHRTEKQGLYNQRNRTDRKFLMDLDAEILEWHLLSTGQVSSHPSWMVDYISPKGYHVDVKFIRKYWNVSREKTLNLIKQRDMLHGYEFYEWVKKPGRPLQAGDEVEVHRLGFLHYGDVADNLRKSFKEPDGFYVDVRALLHVHAKTL